LILPGVAVLGLAAGVLLAGILAEIGDGLGQQPVAAVFADGIVVEIVVTGMKEERRAAIRLKTGAIYCYRVWDEVPPE
jgi:hypothetical protein